MYAIRTHWPGNVSLRAGRLAARFAILNAFVAVVVLLTFAAAAFAQDLFWKDQQGNPAPNTESRSAVNGFGGWLLVTSDQDWRAKWDTPADTIPHFTEAKSVARGKKVFVLIFFANPQLSDAQSADVTCDIDVVRPDGSSSMHQKDLTCFRGKVKGSTQNLYLSEPVIGFIGEPRDPAGKWLVRVTLKDNVRHARLPLKTSFTLQ